MLGKLAGESKLGAEVTLSVGTRRLTPRSSARPATLDGMKDLQAQGLDYFADAPVRLACQAHLAAAPDAVFAMLAEPALWPTWFPLMTRAAWVAPTTTGDVGAERDVALRLLGHFRERMIAWQPGQRFAFTMVQSSSPFASKMAEDYRLQAVAGGTELNWTFAITPTTVGALAVPGLRIVMRKIFTAAGKRLNAELTRAAR